MEKCDRESKKMILQSMDVVLSKLLNDQGKLWCHVAETLEIYAVNSIVFDADISEGLKDTTMMAKEWIIKGKRTIDLRGQNGSNITMRAPDGNETTMHGTDGAVGSPGGSGGSFYGYFDKVTADPDYSVLKINVDGGKGGQGQDGGNGENGQHGSDATYSDFPSAYADFDITQTLVSNSSFNGWYTLHAYSHTKYLLRGTQGQPGGNGGTGGAGGIGGNPGYIRVPLKYHSLPITISREMGEKGIDGTGGRPGEGGRNGNSYQCFWRGVLFGSIRWWDKCTTVEYSNAAKDLYAPAGTAGRTGGNVFGLERPEELVPDNINDEAYNRKYIHFKRFVGAKTGTYE